MAEKKFLPFIVLQILEELSDESHILSTNELINHIEMVKDIILKSVNLVREKSYFYVMPFTLLILSQTNKAIG